MIVGISQERISKRTRQTIVGVLFLRVTSEIQEVVMDTHQQRICERTVPLDIPRERIFQALKGSLGR